MERPPETFKEDTEEFEELYEEHTHVDPDWAFELREWCCPECYELIDVDAVPVGYPVIKPFDPDIDTFSEGGTPGP
ncbi:acetone carboxylase subunit gamma [Halorientalis sp.]|uniref:acetone carboxylase subunit gamma n=1 Tax=Halorientalis sp. TaxID=1931229 RepID=UPI0039C88F00